MAVSYKTRKLVLCLALLTTSCTAFAQGVVEHYKPSSQRKPIYAIRAGVNYSFTRAISVSTPPVEFIGYTDKVAGYLGGSYTEEIIPDQLALRIDLGLQAKGTGAAYKSVTYYYLSATGLVGFNLNRHLRVFLGPEINVLTIRQNPWGKGQPFETGLTSRISYQFNKVGLELSYFRGFTHYDQSTAFVPLTGATLNNFYNQNFQLGLTYIITK